MTHHLAKIHSVQTDRRCRQTDTTLYQ